MATALGETSGPHRYRFDRFEIDVKSGEIWKSGILMRLAPQPFRILALLSLRRGEVISREEVREHIWGDGTVVDFDQRLNGCINQIRTVLGDDADLPRFVETLPRRGYRWIGPPPVTVLTPTGKEPDPIAPPSKTAAGPPAEKASAPLTRRGGFRSAALGLAFLAAMTLAYFWGAHRPAPEPTWHRLTFQRGSIGGGRFAANGEIVYAAAWEGGSCALYSVVAGSPDPRRLHDRGCQIVGASTQGELAFLTDIPNTVLARVPLAGGPDKEILTGVSTAVWSPDGREIAVVYFVPGKTQMRLEWPEGHEIAGVDSPSHLRISPDGRRLALLEHPVIGDDLGQVVMFDRAGVKTVLTREWSSVEGLAWSADGREVWFTAGEENEGSALYAVDLGKSLRRLLPPDRHLVLLDVGSDGRVLLDRGVLRQEVVLGSEGQRERNLSWLDMTSVIEIAPDGSKILINETGLGGGPDYGVYLRPTDGGPPLRVGGGRATALSPDGRGVFSIPIRDRDRIEVLPVGPGQAQTLTDPGIVAYEWAFAFPDGARVLFVGRDKAGAARLYVRPLAGGSPARPIAPENVRAQKFSPISPDGRVVAARCPEHDYCLYPVAGGEVRPIPGVAGLRPVAWEGGGRFLIMRDRAFRPPVGLYRLEVATGRREPLMVLNPPDPAGVYAVTGAVITPDLKHYAYDYMRRLSELYSVEGLR